MSKTRNAVILPGTLSAIIRALECVGNDETRPNMMGVSLVNSGDDGIYVSSTNGIVLHRENITDNCFDDVFVAWEKSLMVVHGGTVRQTIGSLKKILKTNEKKTDRAIIEFNTGNVFLSIGNSFNSVVFKMSNRDFPNIEKVIPEKDKMDYCFSLDFDELSKLVKGIEFKGKHKRIHFYKDGLKPLWVESGVKDKGQVNLIAAVREPGE